MAFPLGPDTAAYLADSYPHNHDYRIASGKLKPGWQLWRRARRIRKHYLPGGKSLLDLSSCKGFFTFDALLARGMERARGIDVHEPDIVASRAAARHLDLQDQVKLDLMHLHEVAAEIEEATESPFATTLLINTYPYLFFGSLRAEHHYPDHNQLFQYLANVTATGGRLIFSNRVEVSLCPGHIQERAKNLGLDHLYSEAQIRAAIDPHFKIEPQGKLGKIPLWVLHKR